LNDREKKGESKTGPTRKTRRIGRTRRKKKERRGTRREEKEGDQEHEKAELVTNKKVN